MYGDEVSWGMLVIGYLFLAGTGAGALTTSASLLLRSGATGRYFNIARLGAIIAPTFVIIGTILLIFELGSFQVGHWFKFFNLFKVINQSPMSIGPWLLVSFILISIPYACTFISKDAAPGDNQDNLRRFLAWICIPLGIGVGVYTGFLLGPMPARPFWNTPIIAMLFLLSALSTGMATLMLINSVMNTANPDPKLQMQSLESYYLMNATDTLLIGMEVLVIFLFIMSAHMTIGDPKAAVRIIEWGGELAFLFWFGVVLIGLLLPVCIELTQINPRLLHDGSYVTRLANTVAKSTDWIPIRPGTDGAVAHKNGNDTERAIQMLAAITGNVDRPGGRCRAVGAKWHYPHGPHDLPKAKKLDILDGFKGKVAFPTHHISHQVLDVIRDGNQGRPDVYMWYCYQPVYSNPQVQKNIEVLKDEKILPYTVCITPFYDESAALADLILPDATYLERWDWEDMVSPNQIAEYYIRQPLVKPLGEVRDFKDVCCELAERLGFPLGYSSAEEFVRLSSCEMTPGVKEAGGFQYMVKNGVWVDPESKAKYYTYKKEIEQAKLDGEGILFDEVTRVYWNWKKSGAKSEDAARAKGYTHTNNAYKGYIGQQIGETVYAGFKPDKLNKSGYFELYSSLMEAKGLPPLPTYVPIPEHEKISRGQLILTTYKVNVQSHSRTQNCKWLSEIYHENPAWINTEDADAMSIQDQDKILIKSDLSEIETYAYVTPAVAKGVIAVANHCGHWEYGRVASGKKTPFSKDDPALEYKWWDSTGAHPNWIIPSRPDPINGQQCWMDTVVTVYKA